MPEMTTRARIERIGTSLLAALGYTLVPAKPGYIVTGAWRLRKLGGVPALLKEMSLAQHLGELITDLRIDCVLDIGANTGQYGEFLRTEVGYRGLILSFEPVLQTFSQLQAIAQQDPNWKTFRIALGRQNEKRAINVMRNSQLNSFLQPATGVQGTLGAANVIEDTEIVEVRRLADLLPSLKEKFGFAR